MLAEKVEVSPVLYDKTVKGFKEKDPVQNSRENVANQFRFCRKW